MNVTTVTKNAMQEREKGDDYYFPQHVERDEDEMIDSLEFDNVDGEEDVLNLDDDEE